MGTTARAEKAERLRLGVFHRMAKLIPPGESGNAAIDHFEITPDTWQGFGNERIQPGAYARLKIDGGTMMSDTDMELRTNWDAVAGAKGDVLIGGLGIGAIALPIMLKPVVASVVIIEKNKGVDRLVTGHLVAAAEAIRPGIGDKLTVITGDIHKWRPKAAGRQFDYIYFDIWQDQCTDNVEEMRALHLFFRRYLRPGGKVTSWEYERLRELKRQGRWR